MHGATKGVVEYHQQLVGTGIRDAKHFGASQGREHALGQGWSNQNDIAIVLPAAVFLKKVCFSDQSLYYYIY